MLRGSSRVQPWGVHHLGAPTPNLQDLNLHLAQPSQDIPVNIEIGGILVQNPWVLAWVLPDTYLEMVFWVSHTHLSLISDMLHFSPSN